MSNRSKRTTSGAERHPIQMRNGGWAAPRPNLSEKTYAKPCAKRSVAPPSEGETNQKVEPEKTAH